MLCMILQKYFDKISSKDYFILIHKITKENYMNTNWMKIKKKLLEHTQTTKFKRKSSNCIEIHTPHAYLCKAMVKSEVCIMHQ